MASLGKTIEPYRKAIIGGIVVGAVIIFLVIIGLPGGASDADGLPAWFVWAVFMLLAGFWGFRSVRAYKEPTLASVLRDGLTIGLAAAAVTVLFMLVLNAAQLWEINQVSAPAQYANGLRPNVTRVQDVLANVTPRTTAVMSGLPLEAIKPSGDTPRSDPTSHFILMSGLLVVAAIAGSSLGWLTQRTRESRQSIQQTATRDNRILHWLPVFLPLIILAFIVFNNVVPTLQGDVADAYRNLLSGNGQLIGLLASYVLIGAGLFAVRLTDHGEEHLSFAVRAGIMVALAVILVIVGLKAPTREVGDLLFSPKTPDLRQIVAPDGSIQVITETVDPITAQTLLLYRQEVIIGIGILLAAVGLFGARSQRHLRSLLATNIFLGSLAIMPLFLDKYQQSVLLLVGINILLGLGLNIVVGYAGLLDLGYVAFFAIGAYTYAFLSSNEAIRQGTVIQSLKRGFNDLFVQNTAFAMVIAVIVAPIVIAIGLAIWRRASARVRLSTVIQRPRWLAYVLVAIACLISLIVIALVRGTPLYNSFSEFPAFIVGLLFGVVAASFAGVLLGIPVLRLRGDYLAIVTLGFGEIIRLFLNNLHDITGGPQGILGIPHASMGNVELGSNEGLLYLVIVGCLLVVFFSMRLKSSRLGRAWGAMRSDEDIARAMGINVVNAKVLAFAFGAAFAGIGGVIFAARQGNIFPDNFTLDVSINVLSLIIIGGMGSIPGVVLGALVLIGIPEALRVFAVYRVLAFGALLVIMMVLRPSGLLPEHPQPMEERARLLKNREVGA